MENEIEFFHGPSGCRWRVEGTLKTIPCDFCGGTPVVLAYLGVGFHKTACEAHREQLESEIVKI